MEQPLHHNITHPTWIFKARLPYCEIWQHSINHTIVQAYPIENYQQTHAKIHRNKPHLVNMLGAITNQHNMRVYLLIQRIPSRLCELGALNQSQSLKVLFAVFKGLQQLQQIYGLVSLTQSCICFNEQGKVKVWINPDLSSLHPVAIVKQNGHNQIIKILYHILGMVARKSFNTTFLKIFEKKLQQNKIFSFEHAAEEISRMSELLFIDIQQKPRYHMMTPLRVSVHTQSQKTQQFALGDFNMKKQQKIQNQCLKTHGCQINSSITPTRRPSNQEIPHGFHHRRVQSFIERDQSKKELKPNNLYINLTQISDNKYSLSQAHKSAPPSPRDQDTNANLAPTQTKAQTFYKKAYGQNSIQKKQGLQKVRLNNKKPISQFKRQNTKPSIYSKSGQEADDSFSHNLKVDSKEIMISGDFQTFGILEQLSDRSLQKSGRLAPENNSLATDEIPQKKSQFNIEDMDLQIQKKLEKKNKEKERQKQNKVKKISTAQKQSIILQLQQNNHHPHTNKLYSQTVKFQKSSNMSGFLENKFRNKENIKIDDPNISTKRQKSSNLAFIDRKYDQYIKAKNVNQEKRKQSHNMFNKTLGKHIKHVSNFENVSIFHPSKTAQQQVHANSYKNICNPLTARFDK